MKRSVSRSPFPWFGGKQKLADDIIGLFPPHSAYVEVFGGGGSVLLSKAPAALDVYNDRDDGLVNFFTVLRDQPEKLVALLELTPYARSEWSRCYETWESIEDPVERARRWYVVASQSFGGGVGGWGGERLGLRGVSRAASIANLVDGHIGRFVERMRLVQIDNLDWRACLDRYDAAECVFYLDPPYVPETRRTGGYHHELTLDDHAELVERVLALNGVAVVSGYDHDIYAPLVTEGGFTRREFDVWCTAAQRSPDRKRDRRREVIWASPRAAEPTLFTGLAS